MDRLVIPAQPNEFSDDELLRRLALQKRHNERLGDNQVAVLSRVYPGDNDQWRAIGDMRREVYVEDRKYLSPDHLDDEGREYDEYDYLEGTVHICATDEQGNVIGYVRILTKDEGLLPAEKTFSVELPPDTVEVSRLISKRSRSAPLVTLALIRAAVHELNSDDKYGQAVATLEPYLAIHLDNMGIPIKNLTDLQETPEYNSSNMLVEMDYTKIVERATRLDPERKFNPVYPERLGPWFAEGKVEKGLGRVALIHSQLKEVQDV